MRVFSFGLSPRGINLINLSTEPIQLLLSSLSSHCLMPLSGSCMHALTTRFSIHALFIQIYRYMCPYPYMPFGIRRTTHWGVLTPLDPHVQVSELRACEFFRLLIRDAQRSVEYRLTVWGSILLGPLLGSWVFPLWLMSTFCAVHSCITLCILAFALYRWCNIIVILCHILW